MTTTVPELDSLRDLLDNIEEIPYCTGTVPLGANSSTLFYESSDGSNAQKLDFTKITDDQLAALARECDPATFGHGQQDVLDEAYRKAGKMDANRFVANFSPTELGVVEIISDQLLRDRISGKCVRIELYKLNIYGPGGFFKAHVDTPRSDSMFASLVVVLPTVHEGGTLIIRHSGKEWTFDSSRIVNAESTPHAAFVAFFSDVEHEVTTVSSGYRVTLTYNLYLKKTTTANRAVVDVYRENDKDIKQALDRLLKNGDFLPDGGVLGFGFMHQYPFNQESTDLSDLEGCLKGIDAAYKRAAESLSLSTEVNAVYWGQEDTHAFYLADHFVDFSGESIESDIVQYLREECNGLYTHTIKTGNSDDSDSDENLDPPTHIIWVKGLALKNSFSSAYAYHGNEACLSYTYGDLCLVAKVPPAQERIK